MWINDSNVYEDDVDYENAYLVIIEMDDSDEDG